MSENKKPYTVTPEGDVVMGKVVHVKGGSEPKRRKKHKKRKKGRGGRPSINIEGGITAGGRIVGGDQINVGGRVVSENKTPSPPGYPEGTKFLPVEIQGEIKDSNGQWGMLKDSDGNPVKNGENFVYIPRQGSE